MSEVNVMKNFHIIPLFEGLRVVGGGSSEGHGHPPASSASNGASLMTNITSSMAMIHQV